MLIKTKNYCHNTLKSCGGGLWRVPEPAIPDKIFEKPENLDENLKNPKNRKYKIENPEKGVLDNIKNKRTNDGGVILFHWQADLMKVMKIFKVL